MTEDERRMADWDRYVKPLWRDAYDLEHASVRDAWLTILMLAIMFGFGFLLAAAFVHLAR